MPATRARGLPLSTRIGAYLTILFGCMGIFAGLSGAATYIPYRVPDGLTLQVAEVLTAIAAIGAILSVLAVVSGWALLRAKGWAWRANLFAAVGCVVTVASLAVVMPASSPSPVPGGIEVFWLVPVVAVAYGVEVLLLRTGQGYFQTQPTRDAAR